MCLQCLVEEYSSLLREDPDVELELSVLRSPSGAIGAISDWFSEAARVHEECLAEGPCLLCDARDLVGSPHALHDWLEQKGLGGVFGALRHGESADTLKALVSKHPDLARRDPVGRSFVGMVFAFGARVELLDVLLDRGAAVHADDWEATPFPGPSYQQLDLAPLARALKRGGVVVEGLDLPGTKRSVVWSRRTACFTRLSARGTVIAERFRAPRIGRTPLLHKALAEGAHEAFMWLADDPGESFQDGSLLKQAMSAVTWAPEKAAPAALERLKMLLRAGLDPNSGQPEPAFYSVIGTGSPGPRAKEILLALKEAGADFTRSGPHGFDLVTYACVHRELALAKLLGRPGWSALSMACDPRLSNERRLPIAKWVLEHEVDLEATNRYFFNETALVMALQSGDRALIDLLVARGARLDAVDRNGVSAAKLLASRDA